MLDIDLLKFISIAAYTNIVFVILRYFVKLKTDRNILMLMVLGLFLYSGIAISDRYSPSYLIFSYSIFIIFVVFGFIFSKLIFTNFGKWISYKSGESINEVLVGKTPIIIILSFITIKLLYLVVPDFRLFQIFNPPSPDIRVWFDRQFSRNESIAVKIIQYFEVLILPFYYFSLYAYRNKFFKLILFVSIPIYLSYVADSYIGRYEIIFALFFLTVTAWIYKRSWRIAIFLILMVSSPVIIIMANAYTKIRLGAEYFDFDFASSLYSVFNSEFSFPLVAGIPIIETGQTVQFSRYLNWIVTLPIPSFMKSGIDTVPLNYEMSEIALGVRAGDPGFYVLLPGLLAESYYIYGPYLYWVHAVFIGSIAAFFMCVIERIPSFKMIYIFVSLLLFLNLNRGGISSVLPVLVNGFIFFFLVLFVISLRKKNQSH